MQIQKKYAFDKVTLFKIGRGALIAGTGAAALFILNAIGHIEVNDPVLVSLIAFFVPFATNIVREWMRGG